MASIRMVGMWNWLLRERHPYCMAGAAMAPQAPSGSHKPTRPQVDILLTEVPSVLVACSWTG